jgi:hypothetical protein
MVIGGSKRHALENPGSRKPPAEPVSKYNRASHDYDEARGQRRLSYALSDNRLAASQARAFGPLCRWRRRWPGR